MKSIGAMQDLGNGDRTYREDWNRALAYPVYAETGFFSIKRDQEKNWAHATPEAAATFAKVLNWYFGGDGYKLTEPEQGYGGMGTLFGRPLWGYVKWSVPKQLIQRPDGEAFAAGTIGYILGNEAAWGSPGDRDKAIFDVLGLAYPGKTTLSDALLTALGVL